MNFVLIRTTSEAVLRINAMTVDTRVSKITRLLTSTCDMSLHNGQSVCYIQNWH